MGVTVGVGDGLGVGEGALWPGLRDGGNGCLPSFIVDAVSLEASRSAGAATEGELLSRKKPVSAPHTASASMPRASRAR